MNAASAPVNADPAELAKFGALAARWWDAEGEFKPLHDINPLRLKWINHCVPLAGQRVIDVGCGGGILAESMAALGAQVTGIDLSEKPLAVAKLHGIESGVSVAYRLASAEDTAAMEPGAYEVVTCMEMLEHVPDPASTIRACAAMARPGGHVFFSTINRNAKAFAFAIVGAEYVLNLLPRGTHEYARFITPSELAGMARDAGLEPVAFRGLSYNPLTRHHALGDDVSVNYLLHCRKSA
ncbi:MAG: bifunctional 2-polyprenyl-6-hydroxyphenol methylase/3-demethylubiquinol 3-O-methyltransferase UbiG [Betaproteobacteria bacterium]|nr:bifunctional 2-polyprenyl-6-hydroxyphenol methylase/3-demethylubiquinol 3-O-methyltransferase UbiG [Betaproteobacteria bacterium]